MCNITELLLDLANCLEICGAVEGVAAEEEELNEVAGDMATGDVEAATREVCFDRC